MVLRHLHVLDAASQRRSPQSHRHVRTDLEVTQHAQHLERVDPIVQVKRALGGRHQAHDGLAALDERQLVLAQVSVQKALEPLIVAGHQHGLEVLRHVCAHHNHRGFHSLESVPVELALSRQNQVGQFALEFDECKCVLARVHVGEAASQPRLVLLAQQIVLSSEAHTAVHPQLFYLKGRETLPEQRGFTRSQNLQHHTVAANNRNLEVHSLDLDKVALDDFGTLIEQVVAQGVLELRRSEVEALHVEFAARVPEAEVSRLEHPHESAAPKQNAPLEFGDSKGFK